MAGCFKFRANTSLPTERDRFGKFDLTIFYHIRKLVNLGTGKINILFEMKRNPRVETSINKKKTDEFYQHINITSNN